MKFIFFLFLISTTAVAQKPAFSVNISGKIDLKIRKQIQKVGEEVTDSLSARLASEKIKNTLYTNGYYLSKGNLILDANSWVLNVESGPSFKWGDFRLTTPDNFTLIFPTVDKLENSKVNSENFNAFVSNYLNYLEDNGYPFAQINIPNYKISNDSISGELLLNPGPFISLDSLVIKGYQKIDKKKYRYLFLFKKGMPYSESYVKGLEKQVNQIEYLKLSRPPAIAFSKNKTLLYLYLENVESNQIDGVVGLNTEENGDVSINGDFNLRLLNTLHKGEEMKVRWRRPDDNVSELDLDFTLPLIFNTPFFINGNLNIFRQDSQFVNTKARGLIKYLIQSGTFLSFGIDYHASNVLSENVEINSNFGSFSTVAYKFGYERMNVDRTLIPTKGNILAAYLFTGSRNSNNVNTRQYGWSFKNQYHLPLFRSQVIMFGLNSEGLVGDDLFQNELFRIGGLKTLRGFNEQSIFASTYAIGTIEYRYMIGEFDYLTVFSDLALANNQAAGTENRFYGLGAGINFRTNGGIFSLFYAVGRDDQNPFDFRTSKIHFGYINRF
jgi:outer membrane translocation and assembly module TamA